MRAGRALGAGTTATVVADSIGLSTNHAVVVGGAATGWTALVDVADVATVRRKLRRAPSADEMAFRQAVTQWLADLRAALNWHLERQSAGEWLCERVDNLDTSLDEFIDEAVAHDDDDLAVSLRRVKDALRRHRDFGALPDDVDELIVGASTSARLRERAAVVESKRTLAQKLWPGNWGRRRKRTPA